MLPEAQKNRREWRKMWVDIKFGLGKDLQLPRGTLSQWRLNKQWWFTYLFQAAVIVDCNKNKNK